MCQLDIELYPAIRCQLNVINTEVEMLIKTAAKARWDKEYQIAATIITNAFKPFGMVDILYKIIN